MIRTRPLTPPRTRTIAVLCIALAGFPGVATGQTHSDTMEVARATARWAQPRLPVDGRLGLTYGAKTATVQSLDDARALASVLHAEPVIWSSAMDCTAPKACTRGEYDYVIDVHVVEMDARGAAADVSVSKPNPSRRSTVYRHGWILQLLRSDSGWV